MSAGASQVQTQVELVSARAQVVGCGH
jgi:hypothetical protein